MGCWAAQARSVMAFRRPSNELLESSASAIEAERRRKKAARAVANLRSMVQSPFLAGLRERTKARHVLARSGVLFDRVDIPDMASINNAHYWHMSHISVREPMYEIALARADV